MAEEIKKPKDSKPEKTEKKSDVKKTAEKKVAEKKTDKKAANKKPNIFKRLGQYFKDVKAEAKKVVWNSWPDTIKNTGVVLMVTVIVGAGVWISDVLFRQLIKLVYTLAGNDAATAGAIMLQNLTNLF